MKKVMLNDLLQQTDDRSTSLFKYAVKQLSRCRFSFTEEHCELIALYKGEKYLVVVTNEISSQQICERASLFIINDEPSVQYFIDDMKMFKIKNSEESLVSALKNYKKENFMPGEKYQNKYYYKFYSKTPLESSLRDLYTAEWIDYEKQLENGNIIFDELGVAGLFAMSYDYLFKSFNEEVKERYGSSLLILRLLNDQNYLCDGKEIIGDRFEVMKKYDLKNPNIGEIGDFVEEAVKENTRRYEVLLAEKDNEIADLYHAINELREDNAVISKKAYNYLNYIKLIIFIFIMFYIIPKIISFLC